MTTPSPLSADPVFPTSADDAQGQFCDAFGGRYYRIDQIESLPPFFISVVSASDLWMFLSSTGSLTAGRRDSDGALFPFQTVDRIHDSAGLVGPMTALHVETESGSVLWEPFAPHTVRLHPVSRRLYKSIEGDRVWFEELNLSLGLVFRQGWATSDRHGFIRQCELENIGTAPVSVSLLDGLRNLLPAGILKRLQDTSSYLGDAYKTAELLQGSSLAVYSLAAAISDRPAPQEALTAAAVWSIGLPDATILLSDAQLPDFVAGKRLESEDYRRGLRCSYFLTSRRTLTPGNPVRWTLVADTQLTQAGIVERSRLAASADPSSDLGVAIAETSLGLRRLVGAADGCQAGGDEMVAVHHFSNTLFNVMRGGVFIDGHRLPSTDFAHFVGEHNRAVASRHQAFLRTLPDTILRSELMSRVRALGDPSLTRLATEYLPLTFSRRHGDPSRPWNRFSIRLRDEQGRVRVAYEGNWRDIFQNWEALCLSHPEFFEAVIAKFLNASTADGHNPYRVTQAGIEWEVPEPEDPWASIGYWGDHQVVYLLKLLEWSSRFQPDSLPAALRSAAFTYARVPYRIMDYTSMQRDPRNTITFDAAAHTAIMEQVDHDGSDARLVQQPGGGVLHVTLTEKLLVVALMRFSHFVPGGGIWMNTQRPEWNDANNALVGYGVSVVTLSYLRRFLVHLREVLLPALGEAPLPLSATVADLQRAVGIVLEAHRPSLARPDFTPESRRLLLDGLAGAGSAYRSHLYTTGLGEMTAVTPAELRALVGGMVTFVDHTLRSNRREDGLFHAYNQLEFTAVPAGLKLHRLPAMLEGQVAALSAGLLSPAETVSLLEALRSSALYRPDQTSYLLYPDRAFPRFLERNVIAPAAWASCPVLPEMLAQGETRLGMRDVTGHHRFHPDLVNADALETRLRLLSQDPRWTAALGRDAARVRELYEETFHHRAFTGRSGSMFGFEGLGCIYWHMVAKLLLAVQENLVAAEDAGTPEAARLKTLYYDVRAGLGFNKSPAEYGAFPTDPYSHTPGHSGAQQPGMTGQVKEEILTRLGELGVRIADGRIRFQPTFLRTVEFTRNPSVFRHVRPDGSESEFPLPPRSLAFTLCTTPVIYHVNQGPRRLRLTHADGSERFIEGDTLGCTDSGTVFSRNGDLNRIDVFLGADFRPL